MRGPVLLVNPPHRGRGYANREGAGGTGVVSTRRAAVYPSLRLGEAAAWLRGSGKEVVGRDLVLEGWAARRAPLPRRLGGAIVQASLATFEEDLAFAAGLRAACEGPLVLTGVALSARADRIAEALPGALLSEAPTGFAAAAALLGEPSPEDPETWPDADWSVMPLGRKRRLPIHHARGCTYGCSYCPYVVATGRRVIARSPRRTAEEFEAQVRRHRPRRVVFRDPAFGIDRESTLELLGRLAKLPQDIRGGFEIETRPECLGGGMLEALVQAGCEEIKLGVETLETEALVASARVGRPEDAVAYREAVASVLRGARLFPIREAGLALGRRRVPPLLLRIFLMRGLPRQTEDGQVVDRETLDEFYRPDQRIRNPPIVVKDYVPPPVIVPA